MAEIQTKQQKRAKFALEELTKIMENGKVNHKLAQFIVGMPNMILSNGIAQTFAFLLSKKSKKGDEKKYGQTFDIMKNWLESSDGKSKLFPKSNSEIDFLNKFNKISAKDYIDTQDECLRLVEWLKRYARAFDAGE